MTGGMAPLVGSSSAAMAVKPNANMYLSIAVAMVGAMMFGLDQGNFGNVQGFNSFRREWCRGKFGTRAECAADKIEDDKAWADGFVLWGATLITFGAAAGAVALGPYLAATHGRRPCIAAGGAICFVGCLMASYLSFDSVPVFYVGRFITGFGVGVSCFALPVYNAEISTPSIRGATGSLFQWNLIAGGFLATLIALLDHDWRFSMLLPGLAGAALMCAAPFLPESPRYLFEREGYEAGLRELEKIRRGDVQAEAKQIMSEIEAERNTTQVSLCGLLREPNLRRRVFIACALMLAQQATGVNAFLGYAGTIFTEAGIDNYLAFNVILNSIMIVGCTLGLLLVDSPYGGRRCQLLFASSIMGPPLVIAAASIQLDWPGLILCVCVVLYGLGFQVAWGTVPWIYPAEIFGMTEKESAVSIAVCLNYLANALVVSITEPMMAFSTPGTFYFYGALNVMNFIFVFLYVVETKGQPLEEIPALFAKHTFAFHAHYEDSSSEEGSEDENSDESE
mmetsp:Transcript_132763/g.370164  ORF Transcript_132763/g.370164 Transcript_132763/m.370164 type:complete len:508 (+) Transcript_132763:84-1607(+)